MMPGTRPIGNPPCRIPGKSPANNVGFIAAGLAGALMLTSCTSATRYYGIDISQATLADENRSVDAAQRARGFAQLRAAGCLRPVDDGSQADNNSEAPGFSVERTPECRALVDQLWAQSAPRLIDYPLVGVSELARRAKGGDKRAQLELGIRFEEGRGIAKDLDKAKGLYRLAASDTGGLIWVYSPPVGNASGRVIPVNTGPKEVGLETAKERLEALE